MKIDFEPPEGYQDDPLSYTLKRRLKEDRNTMTVSLGPPRSGKTTSQIDIGWMAKSKKYGIFNAKDVTFLPRDYVGALASGQPGEYKVFDEPGAEWNNRDFARVENKMLNATHITMGSKYINVGWAVPVLLLQDKVSRMLVNYTFKFRGSGRKGMCRFYQNWVDAFTGKTGRTRLGGIHFAPAWQDNPEELKEYEEMKKHYQDTRYEHYIKEFAGEDDENADKIQAWKTRIDSIVAEIMKESDKYTNHLGHIDRSLISFDFKLKDRDLDVVLSLVHKKLKPV
jgi:hypothetical protein